MKKLALLALLVSSTAFAEKMRVMEVSLGGTANPDSQFVELADPGEELPEVYMFVIYDETGKSVAAQSLPLSAGTTRVVMVNSSGQDEYKLHPGTKDSVSIVNLQTKLPPNGSVCFRRQDGGKPASAAADESGTRLHCMGWGSVSAFPVSQGGTEAGAAPPAGKSLQKLAGCLQVDPPTPNAPSKQACQVRNDAPIVPVDAAPVADAAPAAVEPNTGDDEPETTPEHPAPTAPKADKAPAAVPQMPDRGGPSPDKPAATKKGCNAGGDGSWFGVVSVAGFAACVRLRRKRRADA